MSRWIRADIHAHFRASTGLPIISHDIPSRTVRELADDTLVRLAQCDPFVGIRDATGDVTRPLRLSALVPPGFRLMSGDDLTAFAFMAAGGHGCISTISNVAPDLCRAMFSNCRQGRLQAARHLERRLGALQASLNRQNPVAVKYALSLLGLMSPDTRLPLVELDEPAKAAVARALAAICGAGPALKPDATGLCEAVARRLADLSMLPAHYGRCADRPDRDLFFALRFWRRAGIDYCLRLHDGDPLGANLFPGFFREKFLLLHKTKWLEVIPTL